MYIYIYVFIHNYICILDATVRKLELGGFQLMSVHRPSDDPPCQQTSRKIVHRTFVIRTLRARARA